MADHFRRQIVDAVATAVTGLTTTGSNVFTNRVHRLDDTKLPALVIYSSSETSERTNMNNGLYRELSLVIEGYAKQGATAIDEVMDTIAKEVEVAVAGTSFTGVLDVYLASTDMDLVGEGDNPVGAVKLTFMFEYRTLLNAPDSAT